MSEKQKSAYASVDYRLEKAFNFTLDDLSANQAGFMSQGQLWDVPIWLRINLLNNRMVQSLVPKRQPRQILHCSGKIKVENQLREVHGGRVLMNSHIVSMPSANVRFLVSQEQAQVLVDGSSYHIYYRLEPMQILSLERVKTNG